MRGPKAPKDPTKKRPGLYLMLDKDIAGAAREGMAAAGIPTIWKDVW